jgi:hypothetical protein
MSRWPDDPTQFRPSPRWLGVVVVGVMLAICAVIGVAMWTSAHKADLVGEFSGSWHQSDTNGAARLTIAEEMQAFDDGATGMEDRPTGYFTVVMTTPAGEVAGKARVSGFPPWSTTLHVTLDGQEWTLHYQDLTGTIGASDGGDVGMTFSPD